MKKKEVSGWWVWKVHPWYGSAYATYNWRQGTSMNLLHVCYPGIAIYHSQVGLRGLLYHNVSYDTREVCSKAGKHALLEG